MHVVVADATVSPIADARFLQATVCLTQEASSVERSQKGLPQPE